MNETLIEFILLSAMCLLVAVGIILVWRAHGLMKNADLKKTSLEKEIAHLGDDLNAVNAENISLNQENVRLQTQIEEKQTANEDKVRLLEQSEVRLKKEFENLANKIFEEKGKNFSETNQSALDTMLKPFKQQIEGFQKRINEVHTESIKGTTNLSAEIKQVLETGLKMQEEAINLTSALKGDSQQRGAWGEAQLERTLQMSGLIENTHYTKQDSFTDSEGTRKRTDYIIRLPENKCLIIDSKMTLPDYDRAVSAKTDKDATIAMKAHVKAVRKHIDDLDEKSYTNVSGIESPDYVLMFMPVEPAYIEALKHDKELFSYGYEKNVILVSHTTLIPILRIVSSLWTLVQSNSEAAEIGDKAAEIYNLVAKVCNRVQDLGKSLNTAGRHHTDLVTSLVGRQGLAGKVDRFSELSTKAKLEMVVPEPIQIGETDPRLELEAKPITGAAVHLPLDENEGT